MRDPAEVSGPGRFSRRRGGDPFKLLARQHTPKGASGTFTPPMQVTSSYKGFPSGECGVQWCRPYPAALSQRHGRCRCLSWKGERKATQLNVALCSRRGDTRARVKGGVSPIAIPCTTLGPPEILTPLPASVWVQTGPVSLLAF